ncbi:AraC family transcriptional regulator [Clostridium botulinum]
MWQKCFQNSLLNNSAYDDGLFKNNLPYVIIFNIFKKIDYKSCLNIAQILGYFDQSHFIRDFKQICDVSPNLFLKNMSDFYNV